MARALAPLPVEGLAPLRELRLVVVVRPLLVQAPAEREAARSGATLVAGAAPARLAPGVCL